MLAEQRRVQGGNFDPWVLTDGSPSRNKIRRRLMIEKVVECIDELDQPHLKLLVMHDFMWALIEEWASARLIPTESVTRIQIVIYELWRLRPMTCPRASLTEPYNPVDPRCASTQGTSP